MAMIIAGFPGTGKSYLVRNAPPHLRVSDSDSSKFPKDAFPENYIAHIREAALTHDIVFVSTHEAVIRALEAGGFDFHIVAPHASSKAEYLQRYEDRAVDKDPAHGDPAVFKAMMDARWDVFMASLEDNPRLTRLGPGEFMTDFVIPRQKRLPFDSPEIARTREWVRAARERDQQVSGDRSVRLREREEAASKAYEAVRWCVYATDWGDE